MSTKVFFIDSADAQYTSEEFAWLQQIFLGEGIFGDSAGTLGLAVSQRGAGANMSVDVATGNALVELTKTGRTWKVIFMNNAVVNVPIANNTSGSNRVDAIVVRIDVDVDPNSLKNNIGTIEVVLGSGVSALSDGAITTALGSDGWVRLANVTVSNADTDITTGQIADTRVAVKTNESMVLAPKNINFTVQASDPSTLTEGMVWYNSTTHTLNFYNNSTVKQLGSSQGLFNPFVVTAQSSPDMTVAVASGEAKIGNTVVHYAGGNSPTFTAPVTSGHKRIDLLCIDKTGTLSVTQGTSTAGSPSAPTYPTNKIVLAEIYLRQAMTSIKNTDDSTHGYILRDSRGLYMTGDESGKDTFTASGAIAKYDAVYIPSANTIKSIYPSAMGTGASITTAPTTNGANKSMPLSTAGLYLHIQGGNTSDAKALTAQVRTINAGETDFSNGTEAVIYNTGNGVNHYDICEIGTDKFLIIYQANTSGSGAGIKAVVITVSGTTVTVGTATTIETTGATGTGNACAKLNTDKGIIFYRKDSDGTPYGQVLTVSGTTITTNTPAQVKSTAVSSASLSATDLLGTDSGMVTYAHASNANLYAKAYTVSGTTITFNTENSLVSTSTSAQFRLRIKAITSTKVLIAYEDQGTPVTSKCATIAITSGGATLTMSSTFQLSAGNNTHGYYGMAIFGTTYAMIGSCVGSTSFQVFFVNISGTTPTAISNQTVSHTTTSNLYHSAWLVKVSPFTYVTVGGGSNADGDNLIKMTVGVSASRVGVADADIADAGTGDFSYRFQPVDGFTGLTAGSKYYVDDNAQPTLKSSLSAPEYGIAVSSTKMLLL